MAATQKALIRRLNRLHRICRAGERGYQVVARNVSNRGLKVVLKSYAQQRTRFAAELKEEIQRLGGAVSERRSVRGVIHRGRIDIFAGLTIGPQNVENVALGEAIKGEKVAERAYKRVLKKGLPPEIEAVVERQSEAIRAARDRMGLLRGSDGDRLVVRLFDSEEDAETAVVALGDAGFERSEIEIVDVKEIASVYEGEGSRISETVASGAFGGALWGSIIGAAAGIGIVFIPGMEIMAGSNEIATLITMTLIGTFIGALFGAILGYLIGKGISEEDAYLYDVSVEFGTKLVRLKTNNERAAEAARVLHQINAAARASVLVQKSNEEEASEAETLHVS